MQLLRLHRIVEDLYTRWNRAIGQFPSNAMSIDTLAFANIDLSISFATFGGEPIPTITRAMSINVTPESFGKWFGGFWGILRHINASYKELVMPEDASNVAPALLLANFIIAQMPTLLKREVCYAQLCNS
jgi:hypothetical protein